MRAVIYTRISSARKTTDSTEGAGHKGGERDAAGVERQEKACRELARLRELQVVAVLSDNDRSAYSGRDRPKYQELLALMRRGEVDVVLAWHTDRIYRRLMDTAEFMEIGKEHNIKVFTVRGGDLDFSTSSGQMMAGIMGAIAQGESELKSERLRAQRAQAALDGKWNGGPRTYGYTTRMEVVEDEADEIRSMAQRILAGDSLRAIVRDLNAREVPAARGGTWRTSTVRSLLASARLSGQREHTPRSEGRSYGFGEVVGQGSWEPILTKQETSRLRRLLSDSTRRTARPSKRLLSAGVLRCGRCGEPMNSRTSTKGSWRYACISNPGTRRCGSMSVVGPPVDALVTDSLLVALAGTTFRTTRHAEEDGERERIQQEMAEAESRLADLATDYGTGRISRREWLAARQAVEALVRDLTSRLPTLGHEDALIGLPNDLDALRSTWSDMHLDRQRAVVAAVIDRVIVRPSEHRGRPTFDSGRIEIIWRS